VDIIESIKGSVIQHGPHNNRIYLMRLNTGDTQVLIEILDNMARENGYGKIFAIIPATEWNTFKTARYIKEAAIPGFFKGKTDGLFIGKYFSTEREKNLQIEKQAKSELTPGEEQASGKVREDKTMGAVELCQQENIEEMSAIYQQVFKTYPFPILEQKYLKRMMKEGVLYYCIRSEGRMIALAATEIDFKNRNVEMTDFATLPKWRGMGFAGRLLRHMDQKVCRLGLITAYSIARAASYGMNAVFRCNGYHYAGLLKNNSQICGRIESMTVWYKQL
jgi:putative beta-lysine N-acetyltransferase